MTTSHRRRLAIAGLLAVATAHTQTGCLHEQSYGAVAPSRYICKLGGFRQELTLAPDFKIDRKGDDAYPADDVIRRAFASDAQAVAKFSKCPGLDPVGVFHLTLHRIEVGTSRDRVVKGLMWTLLLLPTLGLSTIYTLSEQRWITLELDATASVGEHQVWSGAFTSFAKAPLLNDLPTTGAQLTELVLRAQLAAVKDLAGDKETR